MARVRVLLLGMVLVSMLPPGKWSLPTTTARPVQDGPPPSALLLVIAYHGEREVKRWSGPMDWSGALPVFYEGRRSTDGWHWSDSRAALLRVASSSRRQGGSLLVDWAKDAHPDRIMVLLVTHPGPPDIDAGDRGRGTTGQAMGADTQMRDAARSRMRRRIGERTASSYRGIARGDEHGEVNGHDDGTGGQGHEYGAGRLRGAGNDVQRSGRGRARGRKRGHHNGAEEPSWHVARHSEPSLVRGGRVGQEFSEDYGGAGGERGATGHIYGSGWLGLLDAPAKVAAAINAALVVLDANMTSLGDRLFQRVVRGLGKETLEREVQREVKVAVERAIAQSRKDANQFYDKGVLAAERRNRVVARIEDNYPDEAYGRLQGYAGRRASEYEQTAQGLAIRSRTAGQSDVLNRAQELCQQNARAYRAIESATAVSRMRAMRAAYLERQQDFVREYRRLNPHSGLSDQEIQDYQRLGYRYHADSGQLYHPDAGRFPPPVDPNRAAYKEISDATERSSFLARAHLSSQQASTLEQLRVTRKQTSDDIDRLSRREGSYARMSEPQREVLLHEKRAAMRDASEELGELAGQAYAARHLHGRGYQTLELPPQRANNFDQVYRNPQTGDVVVLECKDGAGRLGARFGDGRIRVQQGTRG